MDTTAAPTPSTTTLTLNTSDISTEITPGSATGTFVASDPATVSVTTNNYTGYTLSLMAASAGENATKLINNNYTINSISSASDPAEFGANNWGYLPSKFNSQANTKYQPAPTNVGVTLDSTTTANSTANDYTITLGVKADYTIEPGAYENTFAVVATANPISYTITYNKNTTDTVTDLPQTQTGNVGTTDVIISSTIPSRSGKDFDGWNTAADGSGTTYQPGDTISTSQLAANDVTLYAMWWGCNSAATGISNAVCLQDINSSVIASMTAGTTYQLRDYRDGQYYHLAKLQDGRIWLLDNLALDLTDTNVKTRLTSTTTNASTTSLNYLKNGGGTASDKYAMSGVSSDWSNTYSAPKINMDSKDVVPENMPVSGQGNNKVGGYYNFCAASAGSYCYGDNADPGTASGNATEDICPVGWRLPASDEYKNVAIAIMGALPPQGYYTDVTAMNNFRNKLSLPFSGFFYSGAATMDLSSSWWSSTQHDGSSYYINRLRLDYSSIKPAVGDSRPSGFVMRCIAKNPIMQNVSEWEDKLTTDESILAEDSRDNKTYWVLKARDGQIWMTQNLDLDLNSSKTYTPADTDITTNWTPSRSTIDATSGTISGWANSDNVPDSVDVGDWYFTDIYYNDACDTSPWCNYLTGNTNGKFAKTPYMSNGAHGRLGNYYNWAAAIATNDASGYTTNNWDNPNANPKTSICPAGWRLPIISNVAGKHDIEALFAAYSNNYGSGTERDKDLLANPLFLTRSGYIWQNSLYAGGFTGYLWSSAVWRYDYAYSAYVRSSMVSFNSAQTTKGIGITVRCLAK